MKTLSDAAASSVNFTPQDSTVNALRALAAPGVGDNTARITGPETTTYRLTVTLQQFKQEDDRDIHLVVGDPSSPANTMIVEFPDVACEGAIDSAHKSEMQSARNAFVAACGSPSTSSFKTISGTATITGVGFFDIIHGQTGVAPNGIELHPVLSFSGSCVSGGASPTPTSPGAPSPSPSPTPTRTPSPTPTTGQTYQVPPCYHAGQNTCNCSDFTTHSYAQWFHDNYDPQDVNQLDGNDHDGLVCESLPG